MEITIFDLDLLMYQTLGGYLAKGWRECVVDRGVNTISVRISNRVKFTTVGNGVLLEFMGRSILLDRTSYYYIKIE